LGGRGKGEAGRVKGEGVAAADELPFRPDAGAALGMWPACSATSSTGCCASASERQCGGCV
jgi:hypothetical protein